MTEDEAKAFDRELKYVALTYAVVALFCAGWLAIHHLW